MKRFVVAMSLFWSTLLSLACGPVVWAKPADLPADERIQCPDRPIKGEPGGVDLFAADPAKTPAALDAVSPALLPAVVEQWLLMVGEVLLAQPSDSAEKQARRQFEVAEHQRDSGDFGNARNSFQRVHLLAPTSRVGRLAIDRLIEIEERMRESAEGAETAPHQSKRDRAQPLGLVELTY